MTAQFGLWPPAVIGCKLIGRCTVASDGTLAFTSKYADGTPVFTSSKVSTGVYQLTPGKTPEAPTLDAVLFGAGQEIKVTGALRVQTYNSAGAAADSGFIAYLYDN